MTYNIKFNPSNNFTYLFIKYFLLIKAIIFLKIIDYSVFFIKELLGIYVNDDNIFVSVY